MIILALYYVTFQCRRKNVFRKILEFFFALKKLKKPPKKVEYIWQLGFFFLCGPDCPKQPRTSYPFYRFSHTIICSKICDSPLQNTVIQQFKQETTDSFLNFWEKKRNVFHQSSKQDTYIESAFSLLKMWCHSQKLNSCYIAKVTYQF